MNCRRVNIKVYLLAYFFHKITKTMDNIALMYIVAAAIVNIALVIWIIYKFFNNENQDNGGT